MAACETVEAQAAGGRDHRSAPQRAALCLAAQHHEGEEEADRRQEARRSRRRRRAAAQGAEDRRARRAARPASRSRTRPSWSTSSRTKRGDLMTALACRRARQQGARRRDRQGRDRRHGDRRECTCWLPAQMQARVAEAAAKLAGVAKVLLADAPHLRASLAEELAALIVALAGRLRRDPRRRDGVRQERAAARRRAARRDADLRNHRGRRRPTPSSARSMPATRSRPCSRSDRQEGHHRAHRRFQAAGDGGSAAIETVAAPPPPASPRSRRQSSPSPSGPS